MIRSLLATSLLFCAGLLLKFPGRSSVTHSPRNNSAVSQVLSLLPDQDTYISPDRPNAHGGENALDLAGGPSPRRALIRMDLSPFEEWTPRFILDSARLRLIIRDSEIKWAREDAIIEVHRMRREWNESRTNWTCIAPVARASATGPAVLACNPPDQWDMSGATALPYDPTPSATVIIPAESIRGGSLVEADVTADVRAMRKGRLKNFGWLVKLKHEGEGGAFSFFSREGSAGAKPVVTLYMTLPPPLDEPPDSIPAWVYADSNIAPPDSTYATRYVRNIVVVTFQDWATRKQRMAAITAVGGTVVGGRPLPPLEGQYYVRVNGGKQGEGLEAAVQTLNRLPQVSSAIPDLEVGLD